MVVDLLIGVGARANQADDVIVVALWLVVFAHIGDRVDLTLNAFEEVHYNNINYGEISHMD